MSAIGLPLLADAALRAALLGVAVAVFLKLLRLRDLAAETLIWTLVLGIAIAMPLAIVALPAVSLPQIILPLLPPASTQGPAIGVAFVSSGAPMALSSFGWMKSHLALMLWGIYGLVAFACLMRITVGLFLSARLYGAATPIAVDFAQGRAIRTSARVSGPISLGAAIILPADYLTWPQNKLVAVLAHEESHIRRGDFFIQLLAGLYCALFWFNPFAWWLQHRLTALGERASDEAAIRRLQDRTSYAEILVEVSRHAHGLGFSATAMTRGPDIGWRIERILGATPERVLGLGARLLAMVAVLPLAGAIADAHAAIMPLTPISLPVYTQGVSSRAIYYGDATAAPANSAISPEQSRIAPPRRSHAVKAGDDEITYNPRALLDDPAATVLPTVIPLGGRGRKSSGNAVILNMNGN